MIRPSQHWRRLTLKTIEYIKKNSICYIAMNRPEKRNALNYDLFDDLEEAFTMAEKDAEVKVVVLKGNGPAFCAGYDLKESYYLTGPREDPGNWDFKKAMMMLRDIEHHYLRIWNFPKPTIAQLHGSVLAAGCYLQLLCDISVAAEDAVIGHPAMKWGGVSSMPLWQVVLGTKKARYLLFTGRTISGAEAERIGLVSMSVPGDKLEETVDQIAAEVASVPHEGAMHNKEALNTDLEIMGVGALFRYHGQMNALARIIPYK